MNKGAHTGDKVPTIAKMIATKFKSKEKERLILIVVIMRLDNATKSGISFTLSLPALPIREHKDRTQRGWLRHE